MANWFERFLDRMATPKFDKPVAVPAKPVKPLFPIKTLEVLGWDMSDGFTLSDNAGVERQAQHLMDQAFRWASTYDQLVDILQESFIIPMEMDIDGPKIFQKAYDRKIKEQRAISDRDATKRLCINHGGKLYELPHIPDQENRPPIRIHTGFGARSFDIAIRESMRQHIMSINGHGDVKWLSEGDIIHVVEKKVYR